MSSRNDEQGNTPSLNTQLIKRPRGKAAEATNCDLPTTCAFLSGFFDSIFSLQAA